MASTDSYATDDEDEDDEDDIRDEEKADGQSPVPPAPDAIRDVSGYLRKVPRWPLCQSDAARHSMRQVLLHASFSSIAETSGDTCILILPSEREIFLDTTASGPFSSSAWVFFLK